MQTTITEHKVFDGRKFVTTFKPLLEILAQPPCYRCEDEEKNCTVERIQTCEKLTAWLTEAQP